MLPVGYMLILAGSCFSQSVTGPTPGDAREAFSTIPQPWIYPGASVSFPKLTAFLRGPEATRYEDGVVYAFDFFATTCDHCEEVGTLIAEMARVYSDQRVRFIGVSSEPSETVEAWLAKPPQRDDISYAIAADPAHAAEAALQDGTLRRATPLIMFVRDGTMLWYGHPNDAEPILAGIVKGTWNPASVKEDFVRASRLFAAKGKVEALARECESTKRWPDLFRLLDAIIAQLPEERSQFDLQRFTIMIGIADMPADGYALGRALASRDPRDASTRRSLARTTVNSPYATVRDLDFALEMAMEADTIGKGVDPFAQASLAMTHFARGDAAQAVACQERAIELQGDPGLLAKYKVDLERYRTQPAKPLPTRQRTPARPAS